MTGLLAWMIPGWVLLLVAVAVFETLTRKRRRRRTPVAATFTDEFTALFYPTKRMELDHRESISMLRDDHTRAAPPPVTVDLTRSIVTLEPTSADASHTRRQSRVDPTAPPT
ncbi:DUF6191 domain-containing protein [Nocardia noduli]|uniref:DUF6191 domain-containing protein n=1 Tax=Nocardia noduli TaxID=2815722 RepID=UPI001C22A1AA|nr:DUF6191 domain-containing protein [Nocardia noduli]